MRTFEFWILAYLLNSVWQVPLLFLAGWLAARALRPVGIAVEHRVWVIVLLLQSLLPAWSMFPSQWQWLHTLSFWGIHASSAGQAHVSVVMGAGTGEGVLRLPDLLLRTIAISYIAGTAYFIARFLWRSRTLSNMRRQAVELSLAGEAVLCWERYSKMFAMAGVSIAASSQITGPVTMGVRRKLVLLPVSMIDAFSAADFRTILAHEFAHMHRRDFLKNLLYEFFSLPVAYHPLFWLTRARIMESREMICDQLAAAMTERNEYARSLLRLASFIIQGTLVTTPHTIGIFDANVFERRIMKLTGKHRELPALGRVAIGAACAALGLGTCASALALAMHINAPSAAETTNASKAPRQLTVQASIMSRNLLTKAVPIYPPAAKKAKIEGAVVLSVVIGKDGNIKNLQVISGPQELQQSSIDAVRQWTYKPYLLNGDPVEVKTTVNIIYSLNG